MTLYTIRSNNNVGYGTGFGTWSVSPSGTWAAVLNDNSDTSWIYKSAVSASYSAYFWLSADPLTIPANEVVWRIKLRVRMSSTSGLSPATNATMVVEHYDPYAGTYGYGARVQLGSYKFSATGTLQTLASTWIYPYEVFTDNISYKLYDNFSVANLQKFYEVYIDIETTPLPTVVPTVSTPITNSSFPTVTWVYSDTVGGMPQSNWLVRIFPSTTYNAVGWTPTSVSSSAFGDSLKMAGSNASWTSPVSLANGTYRAYVQVAKNVNGQAIFSGWAYAEFVVSVVGPSDPTYTLSFSPTTNGTTIVISGHTNITPKEDASFETTVGNWINDGNATVARSVAQFQVGFASMSLTSIAAGTMWAIVDNTVAGRSAVAAVGTTYTVMASFKSAAFGRSCRVGIRWYTAAFGLISTVWSGAITSTTAGWTKASFQTTVPATAVWAAPVVEVAGTAGAAEAHYVDCIAISPGTTAIWSPGGYTANTVYVTRSDDGGITYKDIYMPVRPAPMDALLQTFTMVDYEAKRGTTVTYKVVQESLNVATKVSSVPVLQSVATTNDQQWWLRSISNPTQYFLGDLDITNGYDETVDENMGVFKTLGDDKPIVVSSGVYGNPGSFSVTTSSPAKWATLKTLLMQTDTFILSDVFGDHKRIRLISRGTSTGNTMKNPVYITNVGYLEVD